MLVSELPLNLKLCVVRLERIRTGIFSKSTMFSIFFRIKNRPKQDRLLQTLACEVEIIVEYYLH